jgi:hypothetical protein
MNPAKVSLTFSEPGDYAAPNPDHDNQLLIETADCGAGNYLVICTQRWAIEVDAIEEFADMLRQALQLVTGSPTDPPRTAAKTRQEQLRDETRND